MSISLVSNAQELNNTITTMPTHRVGNLLLACTARDGSTVAPTMPAGWINLGGVGNNNIALNFGYKYAQSTSESFGTWTNADHVSITVWEGSANTIVFPWYLSTNGSTSTSMSFLAQPAGTFRTSSENNVLFAYAHNRSATNNLGLTLAALTNLFEEGNGTTYQVCVKYQLGRTTAWSTATLAMATSAAWRTFMFCLTEQTVYGIGGGGAIKNPLRNPYIR